MTTAGGITPNIMHFADPVEQEAARVVCSAMQKDLDMVLKDFDAGVPITGNRDTLIHAYVELVTLLEFEQPEDFITYWEARLPKQIRAMLGWKQ